MQVYRERFSSRAERVEFLARQFAGELVESVLDVGCDVASLKERLPAGTRYVGLDIAGKPDIRIDLECIDRLPFEDGEFRCVLCSDVLEHLDNLHRIFNELLRVSKRYVIVSLPNNWQAARVPLGRGRGSIGHYGLPAEAPLDRHKWFFSLSEAIEFLVDQAERHSVEIDRMVAVEKPRPVLVRLIRRARYPSRLRYLNRYAHTLFALIDRGP